MLVRRRPGRQYRRQSGASFDSREGVREAVIHGIGLSYVSNAELVADPSLVKINVQPSTICTPAQLGILEKRKDSRIITAFLDVVRRELG